MATRTSAAVDDLYNAPDDGKYELVDGRLVRMSPTGGRPGHIALRIASALLAYQDQTKSGYAFGDNTEVIVMHHASDPLARMPRMHIRPRSTTIS